MVSSKSIVKTIRLSADFKKLSRARRRVSLTPWLFAKVSPNLDETRVGWSVPRSVGGAVVRNRLKRWIRDFLKRNSESANAARHDISLVFSCKPGADLKGLSRKELDFELERLFKILSKR